MNWNYNSEIKQSTGYEDYLGYLNTYKGIKLNEDSEEFKEALDNIFRLYRKENIYPIIYYNDDGIKGFITINKTND